MPTSTVLPIPDRLALRPRWGDYPIPAITLCRDGKPDFRLTCIEEAVALLHARRCGLCGQPHDYWMVGVGLQWSLVTDRILPEALFHEDCARYALAVCPYLLGRPRRAARPEGRVALPIAIPQRTPDALYLGWTRRYAVVLSHGIPCAKIAPCTRVEPAYAEVS